MSGSKQAVVTYAFDFDNCVQNIDIQLTDDLNFVSQWLNVNRFILETTKTKTLIFDAQ